MMLVDRWEDPEGCCGQQEESLRTGAAAEGLALSWDGWWLSGDPAPKDMSVSKHLEPVSVTLFGKGGFVDIIKLRIWKLVHPGLL